jgi:hypothetical protein
MVCFLNPRSAATHDQYTDPEILHPVYLEDFELQTSLRRNQPQRVKGPKQPMTYIRFIISGQNKVKSDSMNASYQVRIK